MKAIDYYNKYHEDIMNPATHSDVRNVAFKNLFLELCEESMIMIEVRHIKDDTGLPSILRELNDKCNAVVRLLVKNYGFSWLATDAFWTFWERDLPELGPIVQSARDLRKETLIMVDASVVKKGMIV